MSSILGSLYFKSFFQRFAKITANPSGMSYQRIILHPIKQSADFVIF